MKVDNFNLWGISEIENKYHVWIKLLKHKWKKCCGPQATTQERKSTCLLWSVKCKFSLLAPSSTAHASSLFLLSYRNNVYLLSTMECSCKVSQFMALLWVTTFKGQMQQNWAYSLILSWNKIIQIITIQSRLWFR